MQEKLETDTPKPLQLDEKQRFIGATMLQEELMPNTSDFIPETSIERQGAFVLKDVDKTYLLVCGDDRNLTPDSLSALS